MSLRQRDSLVFTMRGASPSPTYLAYATVRSWLVSCCAVVLFHF